MSEQKPNKHENVEDLLDERDTTHGSFAVNSRVSQSLKAVVRAEPGWDKLNQVHKEALDHIFGKIGRIMAGQPFYDDHWDDMGGYSGLPKKFNHGRDEQPRQTSASTDDNSYHIINGTYNIPREDDITYY